MITNGFAQAVLFDLDNTLIDRDASFLAWARWLVCEQAGVTDRARQSELVDLLVRLDAGGDGPREVIYREMRRLQVVQVGTLEEFVAEYYREFVGRMTLDAGTRRLLARLQAAAVPFGIVSNGSLTQRLKIRHLGLDRLTDCVFISVLAGIEKPNAAIFSAAARCLGVDPRSILFVGDDPEADIAGAAGVGMRTVWLHRGRAWPISLHPVRPDYAIDALEDLLATFAFE